MHLYSPAFAHVTFSGDVVTDRAAVQPRRQKAKRTHTECDLCCHTAAHSPYLQFTLLIYRHRRIGRLGWQVWFLCCMFSVNKFPFSVHE